VCFDAVSVGIFLWVWFVVVLGELGGEVGSVWFVGIGKTKMGAVWIFVSSDLFSVPFGASKAYC
jgi:hypothetical protein